MNFKGKTPLAHLFGNDNDIQLQRNEEVYDIIENECDLWLCIKKMGKNDWKFCEH